MNLLEKAIYVIDAQYKFSSLQNISLNSLESGLINHQDNNSNYELKQSIVQRIILSYQKAKTDQLNTPFEYQPGHKWAPQISEKRKMYIDALNTSNVKSLIDLLDNFFRNSGVISIIKYDLFQNLVNHPIKSNFTRKKFIYNMIKDMETWKNTFPDLSTNELEIPLIGNPYGFVFDSTVVTPASFPAYYYMDKAYQLIENITHPIVSEIGGGIGLFAYFLAKKVEKLTYINFDLPEVLVIAQYFLLNAYPEKKFLLYGEESSINALNIIRDFDFILMPNFLLPKLPDSSIDLFVNFHSLSEMDHGTVNEYISQIMRVTRGYFYHENSEVKKDIGYGNMEFPADRFPINPQLFNLIYRTKAIWREKRYWEYLFQRVKEK